MILYDDIKSKLYHETLRHCTGSLFNVYKNFSYIFILADERKWLQVAGNTTS